MAEFHQENFKPLDRIMCNSHNYIMIVDEHISLGSYAKMLKGGLVVGGTLALGKAIVDTAKASEKLNNNIAALTARLTGPFSQALDYAVKKAAQAFQDINDILDEEKYDKKLKEETKKESDAKRRNKEAQDKYDLRHAGDINRELVRENPGAAEARAKAEQLMKAQQGMGILGGMGGATQQEQKALWEADQILQREARHAARGGTRNIAMEQEVARRKTVIMQRIANRNKGVGDAMQAVQDESGGDPNKAQEIMAGFTDWYSGMVKAGSRQVGTAAQVINQYITVSHANIAMSEQQKAAYNMKRSMMPGVP